MPSAAYFRRSTAKIDSISGFDLFAACFCTAFLWLVAISDTVICKLFISFTNIKGPISVRNKDIAFLDGEVIGKTYTNVLLTEDSARRSYKLLGCDITTRILL